MYDAARSKARRGELRISVPIGYCQRRSKTRPVGRSKTRPLTVRADVLPRTSERRCAEPLRSAAHRRGVSH
jgi:hypothetical protein